MGVAKDVPRALEAFRVGCKGGLPDACFEGSRLVWRDAALKLAAATKASPPADSAVGGAGGAATGSSAAATAPAAAPPPSFFSDRDFTEDLREGLEMLERGCSVDSTIANARCCGALGGSWFSNRLPVAQVWDKVGKSKVSAAAAASSSMPQHPIALTPEQLAAAAKGLPALDSPLVLLETACSREHADSCLLLGQLYRYGHRRLGVDPDCDLANNFDRQGYLWKGMTERAADRAVAKRAAAAAARHSESSSALA